MTDLQSEVAVAADQAGAHSTAPALLLQAQAALGRLAGSADAATEGGRRPYRITEDWAGKLGELAYLIYLLADQTGVSVDEAVREVSGRVTTAATAQAQAEPPSDEDSWI